MQSKIFEKQTKIEYFSKNSLFLLEEPSIYFFANRVAKYRHKIQIL